MRIVDHRHDRVYKVIVTKKKQKNRRFSQDSKICPSIRLNYSREILANSGDLQSNANQFVKPLCERAACFPIISSDVLKYFRVPTAEKNSFP